MRIVLLGYGKMGKVIEQIALERGHTIVARIDAANYQELETLNGRNADVAIEFSQPASAFHNLQYCLNNGIPVVCGTTGWLEHKPAIEQLARSKGGAFFYASNYSIGVNLFFRLNKVLARWMNAYPQYEVAIREIHHTEKKDAPSGTAITLAEGLLQELSRKSTWKSTYPDEKGQVPGEVLPQEVAIHSFREPEVPGTHTIQYDSAVDSIEITHTAHSRQGFALGAVVAAEWLRGQWERGRTGSFGMEDLLAELKFGNE